MDKKIILTTLSPKSHRTSEENLGIEYLKSSLVASGYNVDIIDAWLTDLGVEEVYKKIVSRSDKILLVGISSYMSNTSPTMKLITKLKEFNSNIKVVCGGFGPSFYPKSYLENGADYIIRGEGEEAICELADCIRNQKDPISVKNVGYKKEDKIILNDIRCLTDDLDSIPFPSRDVINVVLDKKSTVNILTARGCSGNCEFCSVISFFRLGNGKVWRTRSIQNIVDEIEELYKSGVVYIKVVDDSFVDGTRDEKWCEEFADEIDKRGIKVRLRGQIRADKITDSVLKNLKRAGFFSFACGIENGLQTALSRMNKKATLEDNKRALELFKKYGYLVQMGYILFDKYTTLKELEDNYEFMSTYNFAVTKGIFSEMFSAEGTKLNNKLKEEGQLTEGDFLSNNNKYQLDNSVVLKVYSALKLWHKAHSEIYDMAIDPLTAPKAISNVAMSTLYEYVMQLKKKDLEIFKEVLLLIKQNPECDLTAYIKEMISDSNNQYHGIYENVKRLYKQNDLQYNADKNPFI